MFRVRPVGFLGIRFNRQFLKMKSYQDYDWEKCQKLYAGISGTGKTSLMWRHFTQEKARVKFLFDHKEMEFSRRYIMPKGGPLPAFTADELMERTEKAVLENRGGIVAYSPMKEFPGRRDEAFEMFCEWLFAICATFKGRKLFGCDELQAMVDERSKPEPLLVIGDEGRTYQIDCFFITSASNAIHNRVRGQFTEAFCFFHCDKNSCVCE